MRQIRKEEIEGVIKLLKNSSIRVNRKELDINMKYEGDFIVVEEKDLIKIFGVYGQDTIKNRLDIMGYKTRHSCGKWYFVDKKEELDELGADVGGDVVAVDVDAENLKNLEEEMSRLEDKLKTGKKTKGSLCRLINLRKIYSIRKGDKESLFLDESLTEQFRFCKISKYEEIRLGFELLFGT
jgi:hypothetical protein